MLSLGSVSGVAISDLTGLIPQSVRTSLGAESLLDVRRVNTIQADVALVGSSSERLGADALLQVSRRSVVAGDWLISASGGRATVGTEFLTGQIAKDVVSADWLGTVLTNLTAFGHAGIEWLSDATAADRIGADSLADVKAADQVGGDTASRGASVGHAGADALLDARSVATAPSDVLSRGVAHDQVAADSLGTATVSLTAFGTGGLEWTADMSAQAHVGADTATRITSLDRIGADTATRGTANDKTGADAGLSGTARASVGAEWLKRSAATATLSADTTSIMVAQTALGRAGIEWTLQGYSVAHVAFDWLGPAFTPERGGALPVDLRSAFLSVDVRLGRLSVDE